MSEETKEIKPEEITRITDDIPKVDPKTHIVVKGSDGKYVVVSKKAADKCDFLPQAEDGEIPEFEYPSVVLEHLVHWCEHYGMNGVSESDMTRPCIYRSFQTVLKEKWDNDFFVKRLNNDLYIEYYLQTINAAEKLNMKGFHDFLCIGLGCKFRTDDDAVLIHRVMGISEEVTLSPEDLEALSNRYPWFDEAIAPNVRK